MPNYPNPIQPHLLDLVMRDHDHAVYYADKVMLTPGGHEVADRDIRLLKHILAKLTIYGSAEVNTINAFAIFCRQRDGIGKGIDRIREDFGTLFHSDPLVRMKTEGVALLDAEKALTYLEAHPAIFNLVFWGMPEVGRRFVTFYDEITEGAGGGIPPAAELLAVIEREYEALMGAQQAAVGLLSGHHRTGILLPLMLVRGRMTPSEYATAALAVNLSAVMRGEEGDDAAIRPDIEKPDETYRELHAHAGRVTEYLSFFTGGDGDGEPGVRDLIMAGESYNLEFKTSLRWDVHQEKKNPAIEHASLKTICAFLNSSGGHLLIGVEDDGLIRGVEIDQFENGDRFLLHFWNLVKSSMGQEVTPYIRTILEKVEGRTVCHVRCMRSPSPVFLRQKGFPEEFYIRTGPSSASLEIREALKYIGERFAGK